MVKENSFGQPKHVLNRRLADQVNHLFLDSHSLSIVVALNLSSSLFWFSLSLLILVSRRSLSSRVDLTFRRYSDHVVSLLFLLCLFTLPPFWYFAAARSSVPRLLFSLHCSCHRPLLLSLLVLALSSHPRLESISCSSRVDLTFYHFFG